MNYVLKQKSLIDINLLYLSCLIKIWPDWHGNELESGVSKVIHLPARTPLKECAGEHLICRGSNILRPIENLEIFVAVSSLDRFKIVDTHTLTY